MGGENGGPKIYTYVNRGGNTENASHLFFTVSGSVRGKPNARFSDIHKLSR